MSLGQEIIAWIEDVCGVPEGALVGRPMRLAEWQKREILRIYDNPARTRRAILSFSRKNGKTCLAAMLLLAHLCGPVARRNSQLFSAAQSRDQASLLYNLAAKMVRLSPKLFGIVDARDSLKQLICPSLGNVYRALSAEASTAYGLSPAFVVHDELGRVRGPRSALYEALETASGAQASPLSVIISTQAPSDQDLLSVLIDDALAGHDPRVVCSLYTAPRDLPPFEEATIRLANPGFGDFQNPEEVMAMARDAQRMPAREAAFRNLVLNQRVEASTPFLAMEVWRQCGDQPRSIAGLSVFAGLDLSETTDLTACVLGHCDPTTGIWHIKPYFWLPEEGLAEKAARDKVPYDSWSEWGFLETTPGRAISYEWIAERLKEIFDDHVVEKVGFDRYNWTHLEPWLSKAGFSRTTLERIFVQFGQGTVSMSPALRDLESLILNRKLRHGNHPILMMNMQNAVVVRDDVGNRKLSKKKSRGRIDGATALAMCIGVAPKAFTAKVDTYVMIPLDPEGEARLAARRAGRLGETGS